MAETYTGETRNGVVVFEDAPAPLPEGARVRVELIEDPPRPGTLADRLQGVIGQAQGLPPDLAENHDHYLHGRVAGIATGWQGMRHATPVPGSGVACRIPGHPAG